MKMLVLLAYLISSFLPFWSDKQPPEPIEGVASFKSNEFNTAVGNFEFAFHFPTGWGLGNFSVTDGVGHFDLYPKKGGLGCTIDANLCLDKKELKNRLLSLEKSFRSVTRLKDGFEAKIDDAKFFCKTDGPFLIQIWYVNPSNSPEDLLSWEGLKQCLTILDPETAAAKKVHHVRVTEEPGIGWWCHQPKSLYDLLFETVPVTNTKPNQGGARNYYLQFSEINSSGFFYFKSNVAGLDKAKTYKDHLKLMDEEVKKIDPTQKTETYVDVDLNNRYAKLAGTPYQYITLAGDGFLFGFAVKAKNPYVKPNLDDLVQRVKWKMKKGNEPGKN